MNAVKPVHFSVSQSWDGSPLFPEEGKARFEVRFFQESVQLSVEAPLYGDPPPPSLPGSTDRLWEYEVVEWFVVGKPAPGSEVPYFELELSPHGHYLALRLEGVRNRVETLSPLDFTVQRGENLWQGKALFPRAWLPAEIVSHNAYALHGVGESRRYLAMNAVPGPAPDFHRLAHFAPFSP